MIFAEPVFIFVEPIFIFTGPIFIFAEPIFIFAEPILIFAEPILHIPSVSYMISLGLEILRIPRNFSAYLRNNNCEERQRICKKY